MIIVEQDKTAFSRRLAELFTNIAKASISGHQIFNAALCGGSTPRAFHQRLARPPYNKEIPWVDVHLFWVDERCVPAAHPESNFGNATSDFIEKIGIPQTNVHPMPGEKPPLEGAEAYHRELRHWLTIDANVPIFDLILLGVGEDGHVASLFPGDEHPEDKEWVKAVKGGHPDLHRLTLTYPVLNRARNMVFLVSGRSKARIVYDIFHRPELHLPAQKIKPENGIMTWVLDKDAAAMLKI